MKGVDSMAVKNLKIEAGLVITYKDGKTPDGRDKLKSTKFSKVNAEATDDSVYAVGLAIGAVMRKQLVSVERDDTSSLTEGI